jgi:hypothetical protein
MSFLINKTANYFSKTESPVNYQNLGPLLELADVYPILLNIIRSSGNPNIKTYQDITDRRTSSVSKNAIGAYQISHDLYEIIELVPEIIHATSPIKVIKTSFISKLNKILLLSLSAVVIFIVFLTFKF